MKTRMIKLVHPRLGVCAQEVVYESIEAIKRKWRYKYGKKFFECNVILDDHKPKFAERKVVNIATGDVYDSPHEASKELGISITTVRTHLSKRLSPDSYHLYKVRWALTKRPS